MSGLLGVLIFALAAGSCGAEMTPFPNNGFLGFSYDIFFGNPHVQGGHIDPGFKRAVLNLTYEQGSRTADRRYSGLESAGIEQNDSHKREQQREFSDATTTQYNFNVGGKYEESVKKWTRTVTAEPAPIQYTLERLDSLLTTAYLPGFSHSNLEARRKNLVRALDSYCLTLLSEGSVSRCDSPGPDPVRACMNVSYSGVYQNNANCGNVLNTFACPPELPLRGLSFTHYCGHNEAWEEKLMMNCATLPSDMPSQPLDQSRHYTEWKSATDVTPGWTRIQCPTGLVAVGIQTGHDCHHDETWERRWQLICSHLNTDGGFWLDSASSRYTDWLQKTACGSAESQLWCHGPNEVVTAVEFSHAHHHDRSCDESFRLTCTPLRAPVLGCSALELGTEQLVI